MGFWSWLTGGDDGGGTPASYEEAYRIGRRWGADERAAAEYARNAVEDGATVESMTAETISVQRSDGSWWNPFH